MWVINNGKLEYIEKSRILDQAAETITIEDDGKLVVLQKYKKYDDSGIIDDSNFLLNMKKNSNSSMFLAIAAAGVLAYMILK